MKRDKLLFLLACAAFLVPHMVVWAWDTPPADEPVEAPPEPAVESSVEFAVSAVPVGDIYPDPNPDPNEDELIEAALVEQGYFREDVPLSFHLQDHAQTACEAFGVPYPLLLGLIETESNFDPEAVSSEGCYGFMQLNPKYFSPDLEPWENIWAGTEYLGELLERHEAVDEALTAYNAGYDTGHRVYSDKVLAAAGKWADILR